MYLHTFLNTVDRIKGSLSAILSYRPNIPHLGISWFFVFIFLGNLLARVFALFALNRTFKIVRHKANRQ